MIGTVANAQETELLINIQVPRKLHQRLKVEAAKAGISLKDAVAIWLENGIGQDVLRKKSGAK